ncbi:UDP-N-acetylglucosamine 1-carboxyvinyltransferase [Paenibacillus contaminans]|uniref:UDP-N-acetylglucosamine 1-carboxyvinyltransferase n=1 Tax=Paenibacillus contaminans TaxID=450362 RepID=A0A329MMN9_9BACL|nr:UDP-N-acetylglucosamine 1-carboxyvinyltransferase [Paenibacillus contaminans]RAV20566.1 UDP-N-acetylglucosamine 1-carboxyvinyltransferase [Paenibacillus contaminans]
MKWIEANPSGPLQGTVKIPGSKNSSLALLAAACLADEPVMLKGIPNILDFRVIADIVNEIGVQMVREPSGDIIIDPRQICHAQLDTAKTSKYRASYYFVGALLAKFGKVTIGYPGGDDFVSRPIDQHIKVLKAMGATITFHEDRYDVEAQSGLKGCTVHFDTITSGATINAMLAAVLAEGRTELRQAAVDPEVVDTANLLNLMGAKISGAGTDTVRIQGVKQLGGCEYSVIPDRLIAGAFLMAAGATKGVVTVDDVIPEHLGSCLTKLREIGLCIEQKDQSLTAYGDVPLRATRVRTGMYPVFATDLQQPITALLLRAPGRSIVTDKVYPNRFNHVPQLRRMGAEIQVRRGSAFIQGGMPLKGAFVHVSDVRAGTCLLIASLIAEGTTIITGVDHIERGYEDVIGQFRSLGADLTLHEGEYGQVSADQQRSMLR